MKILCLGGAGCICREAALDAAEYTDYKITIADVNEKAGRETAAWMGGDGPTSANLIFLTKRYWARTVENVFHLG